MNLVCRQWIRRTYIQSKVIRVYRIYLAAKANDMTSIRQSSERTFDLFLVPKIQDGSIFAHSSHAIVVIDELGDDTHL